METHRMTPEAFAYWLQGYIEIQNPREINENQTQIIKDHLALVFNKVMPDRGSVEIDDLLNEIPEHSIDKCEPIFDCNLDIS